jgi:hypothetical protein
MVSREIKRFLCFSFRANSSPENVEVESENESEFFTIGEKFLNQEICEVEEPPPPVDHVVEAVCKLEHQVNQTQKVWSGHLL